MKMNKLASVFLISMGMMASGANAADQGHGKVTFTGSIIDAPCSITPETADQTVMLGQVASHVLKDGGTSAPKNFTIDLENCSFDQDEDGNTLGNSVAVTFSGTASTQDATLLGLTGEAAGAGVAIADESGKALNVGTPSSLYKLAGTNPSLGFTAYLKGISGQTIKTGDFESVANFTMDYQ
ncbi:fimbria A protein [Enterobacter cancerogenus]|uniref:fimbrial protein n=1 Tax=Enterobacter cancerogenus TaxID=69218 RepID=UPI000C99F64C|nr:fimbrial protein [Enterobacter cancerogenus]PNF13473.1 fimbria A protein [Enterobacter cancerogenus]